MSPQQDVRCWTSFELLSREVRCKQLIGFFGSSLTLSQCCCYMPRLSTTPAVLPMFQRLVLPFKLFLKIFLGLLYCMFTLIRQSYRSFPLSLFGHDFSFLNNAVLFLRDALTCRRCVCCTCAVRKASVSHPKKISHGCTCLKEQIISDVSRVGAGGREQLSQTALKTGSETDVHIY